MILDPEKIVSDYTPEEQAEIVDKVRSDALAAEENRTDREEIALEDYELYMRKRREAQAQAQDRGGWAKVEIPIVYWNVEHQLPRLGVDPPTITVKALNSESVPYQLAKQLRLQYYLARCGWDLPYQMVARSKLILGDGIAMVPWSPKIHMPRIVHVDWFDFFVSAESTVFEQAECHFHRTFWTPRGLEELEGEVDEDGRHIWQNLDELTMGTRREEIDETWARRRGLADQGSGATSEGHSGEEIPFVSCWYSTGEYIVLGGKDYTTLIRAQMSPYRRRVHHPGVPSRIQHLRPFAFFRNIPDLTGPYSLSEPRALGDHQLEMSTLRNQWMDQVSLDVNAPIVYDEALDPAKVTAAFAAPKGFLAVPWGPSGPLIMRMPAGQPSAGVPMVYDQIRNESQLISGMNDNAAGQAVSGEQTATEVTILSQEANKRMQLKRKMDEIGMREVGRMFDYRDRQFGGLLHMELPTGVSLSGGMRGFMATAPDQMDTSALMSGRGPGVRDGVDAGFVQVTTDVNKSGREYDVLIDAGSAVRADQAEEANRLNAFVAGVSHPEIALRVDWDEVTRTFISAHGFSPERLFRPAPPPVPVGPDGQPLPPVVPA